MDLFARVMVVLVGCPIGILIIWKRSQIVDVVGILDFAEIYLGGGGTYTLFLLIGLLVFVGSLMYGTGSLQNLFAPVLNMFF